MNFEIIDSLKVNFEIDFEGFDCGFPEVNEYFIKDSLSIQANYQTKLYLVVDEEQLIGFFSLTNDKITFDDVLSETSWSLFKHQYFPKQTDLFSVPAIKIGHMGIDLKHQNTGLGC